MAAATSQKEVHWQRTRSLMIVHLVDLVRVFLSWSTGLRRS